MTDEEAQAIKARADATTPGPWVISGDLTVYSAAEAVTTMEWASDDTDDTDLPPYTLEQHTADAAFIAHAREDIPALLAEVAAWRKLAAQAYTDILEYGEVGACHCGVCDLIYDRMSEDEARRLLEEEHAV